jgi:hypothetical protein
VARVQMPLQLAHVVAVVLTALALKDLLLLVAHEMLLKCLGCGAVLERTGLDGTAEDGLRVVHLPHMFQQGEEAGEGLWAAVAGLKVKTILFSSVQFSFFYNTNFRIADPHQFNADPDPNFHFSCESGCCSSSN